MACIELNTAEVIIEDDGSLLYRIESQLTQPVGGQVEAIATWSIDGEVVASYDPYFIATNPSFAESDSPPGEVFVETITDLRDQFGSGDVEMCIEIEPKNAEVEVCE